MHRTTVRELMSRDVVTLSQEQAVPAAQELIRMLHIRHLPVVSSEGALIGLVTQRQLLAAHALLLEQLGSQGSRSGTDLELTIPVSKVMETDVQRVGPDTFAVDALELMLAKKIGSLPVVEDGKVVGIITSRDFLTFELKKLRSGEHEATATAAAAPPPAPRGTAPWMLALPVLLTLALAGFLVYREVTRPSSERAQARPDVQVVPRNAYQPGSAAPPDRGPAVEGRAPLPGPRPAPQPGAARKPKVEQAAPKQEAPKRSDEKKAETKRTNEAKKTESTQGEPKVKKEQPWIPEPIPKAW